MTNSYLQKYKKTGDEIRRRRQNNQLTQKKLAEEIGYSISHLSKVENSICKPSLRFIFKVCNTLNINLNTFFWFVENEKRKA